MAQNSTFPPLSPSLLPGSFTVSDLDHAIAYGAYAWPGGYPIYFVTSDCSVISWDALKANRDVIAAELVSSFPSAEWAVVGFQINWENPELYCDVTGKRIESAYAEDLGFNPDYDEDGNFIGTPPNENGWTP